MASRTGRVLLTRGLAAAGATSGSARWSGSALAAAVAGASPAASSSSSLLAGTRGPAGSLLPVAARGMAGGAHGEAVTYAGMTLHKPASWQKTTGTVMASIMWFWVFVRFYHDWDLLFFGPEIHLKHDDHDEEHH
eukprot:CAMPEP_0177768914 /NCGR_PEP_ID=MMETSP0491_2-20121128/10003_1 /TAXON_ID=63592 /ORGANISM="Tetraselmis chuii, Strain PLY429" /LENGTH=134 /DNA_ID=CAMNT_0019285809 /DNA_START=82 /DNA_END=486 /DNA_ORIENTATION=-